MRNSHPVTSQGALSSDPGRGLFVLFQTEGSKLGFLRFLKVLSKEQALSSSAPITATTGDYRISGTSGKCGGVAPPSSKP